MMRFCFSALCATLGLVSIAAAAFSEPSSSNNDFAQRWFVGDTIHIAWDTGWSWGVGTQPKVVDLFITWFDDSIDNPFWRVLQTNIFTNVSGNYDWKIDLEDTTIAKSTQYHFRLIEHANSPTYSLKVPRLPSRGFNVYANQNNSSSSSIASATSSAATSTPTFSESNVNTTKQPEKKKKKHIGAIAGGVIAVLVVIALLCVVALILLKRAHKKKNTAAGANATTNDAIEGGYVNNAKVDNQHANPPVELGGATRHEIDGTIHAPGPAVELEALVPKQRP